MSIYTLHVKAGSKKGPLVEIDPDNTLTVFVRERAIDGKANQAVIALIAQHFQIPKTSVTIKSGLSSRRKIIEVTD